MCAAPGASRELRKPRLTDSCRSATPKITARCTDRCTSLPIKPNAERPVDQGDAHEHFADGNHIGEEDRVR